MRLENIEEHVLSKQQRTREPVAEMLWTDMSTRSSSGLLTPQPSQPAFVSGMFELGNQLVTN